MIAMDMNVSTAAVPLKESIMGKYIMKIRVPVTTAGLDRRQGCAFRHFEKVEDSALLRVERIYIFSD